MIRSYLLRLKIAHLRAISQQKGQSIIIFTFAVMGLIAMLGLALDLGLVYIEKIKVSRTADAAALAAVVELPFEEEAMSRAIEYIELNGYKVRNDDPNNPPNTQILIRGCIANRTTGVLGNYDAAGDLGANNSVPITPTKTITGYSYLPFPPLTNPRAIFVVDTLSFQPVITNSSGIATKNKENCTGSVGSPTSSLFGTANKLRVSGEVNVPMNFMQFFGFRQVPVQDQAIGENVTNLDVAVVFDVSGSMDFETNCFGCWKEDSVKASQIMSNPYPTNGTFNPLGSIVTNTLCTSGTTPLVSGSYRYLVHEAEYYSRDVPLHGWEFEKRVSGQGFWVLQRVIASSPPATGPSGDAYLRTHPYPTYSQSSLSNYPAIQGAAYDIQCFNGAVLSGECWKTRATSLGEPAPSNVPWVEYDFTPNWSGSASIWIRAQGGSNYAYEWYGQGADAIIDYTSAIFWQVDGNNVQGQNYTGLPGSGIGITNGEQFDASKWRWIKLGTANVTNTVQSTLKLYQGSSGFMLDKIIITNNPDGAAAFVTGATNNGTGSAPASIATLLQQNSGKGPVATAGSATREACNQCNPEFGLTIGQNQCSCKKSPSDTAVSNYLGGGTGTGCTEVLETTNQLSNDLFGDQAPLRNAQEAVKNFAFRLDPKFDQIGFVVFSTDVNNDFDKRSKLQCLRWATSYGGAAGVAKCYDPANAPISYTTVIQGLENQDNNGATDIAEGMLEGLEELGIPITTYNPNVDSTCTQGNSAATSNDGHSCDRRGAARKILVLMTDGSPNRNPGCDTSFKWRGTEGANNNDYNCAIWYAKKAAENNVIVYTIGIGAGANRSLLEAMATGTDPFPATTDTDKGFYFGSRGGKYYPAAKPSDLDQIFTDILGNTFVRIVG